MVGLVSCLLLNLIGGEEPTLILRVPQWHRGDELTYQGQILEVGEQLDKRFRKEYDLELKLFVLEKHRGSSDVALLTKIRPKLDKAVANTADALTGPDVPRVSSAAVRLDLLRIDDNGTVHQLAPPTRSQPLALTDAKTLAVLPLPLETPASQELGLFLPLPTKPLTVGEKWTWPQENRPPIEGHLAKTTSWNGTQCLQIQLTQQTAGWEQKKALNAAWRRQETLCYSPADGLVHQLNRRIERYEGTALVGWIETRYELAPLTRRLGGRYDDVRREIELAYLLQEELRAALQNGGKVRASDHRLALSKIDRLIDTQLVPGPFRDAIDSVKRRWNAAARGDLIEVPPLGQSTTSKTVPLPQLGQIVPDFTAPLLGQLETFHLAKSRGQLVVVHVFRPGAAQAAESLAIAEAAHTYYKGRVQVVSLAIRDSGVEAERRQAAAKLTHRLADGTKQTPLLEWNAWPQFWVIDQQGRLAWSFTGVGPESGYLLKQELDRQLSLPTPRNR